MKRLFTFLALMIITATSSISAQNKGDSYIGGMLGAGISSSFIHGINNSTTSTINASASFEFGYFIANKLKLGAEASYGFSADSFNIHALTIGPNITYYARLTDNIFYTPSLTVCFAMAAAVGEIIPGFGIGINLFALEFRPTKRLGFSASIASMSYTEFFNYEATSTFGVNLGVNPTIGFKYYF